MPFFDDSGPRPEQERSPIWRSFALVKDQLERLVLVNLLWALQTIPLWLALAFDQIPAWLRVAMSLYTAIALAPATAALFAVVADLGEGIPLDREILWNHFKTQVKPGFLKLLPLLSLFYWVGLLASYAAGQGWLIVDTSARLVFLLLLVFSLYWGPLLVHEPKLQAWGILFRSAKLFWKRPGPTLLMGLACLLALALGVVSIAGFMLIVPVLIALFQVQLYLSILPKPTASEGGSK
jgi:hypothetical protein